MLSLKETEIRGNPFHVKRIRNLFGDVRFCSLGKCLEENIVLNMKLVMENYFRCSNANTDIAPLYIVYPSREISSVWPFFTGAMNADCDVKFGTATIEKEIVTQAVAISKGMHTLYLCLSPRGFMITNIVALGI